MAGAERAATAAAAPRWREVFAGARGRLTAGLLMLEMLVAVQILIVTTIMPAVRRDLGDVALYGWTFSASGLGQFAAIPIAGHALDRFGARKLLAVTLVVYGGGLVFAALAPSMLMLVFARLLQGVGGGAMYAVSLGTVAKTYPDDVRARVLALLAAMWILPGLVGPAIGALIASTVGWRWAFVVPIPILAVAAALVFPALSTTADREARITLLWPLVLAIGAAGVLAGLTDLSIWSIALIGVGLPIALPALLRIVPEGTLRARPGLPAAAAAAFLLSVGFLAVDAFVPLMLTDVRGRSVAEAGIVVTLATVTWSLGSWWQSSVANRFALGRLVQIGTVLLFAGSLAVTIGMLDVPLVVPYAGWAVAGLGMGIAFPTIPLSVMNAAAGSEQAGHLSATLLMDTLGVAVGAGLAGASVAFAQATDSTLRSGLVGAFALGLVTMLVLLAIAMRIPPGVDRSSALAGQDA
ncbi:MAG: MFS transporter [Candidatus Velamenicoccus archaeovorus]